MAGEKPKSPFGRIARRITGMVWKVMLGSRPEKRSAAEAIVAARRVTETEVGGSLLGSREEALAVGKSPLIDICCRGVSAPLSHTCALNRRTESEMGQV